MTGRSSEKTGRSGRISPVKGQQKRRQLTSCVTEKHSAHDRLFCSSFLVGLIVSSEDASRQNTQPPTPRPNRVHAQVS